MRFPLHAAIAAVSLAAFATPAAAQMDVERFARSNFNFTPPGARSAGMGGAFTAVADDATAVESNPAGLTVLLYPQASFELKAATYRTTIVEEAGGGPGGRTFDNGSLFPSFVSVALPFGRRDGEADGRPTSTLAASYSRVVNSRGDLAGNGYMTEDRTTLFPWVSEMNWKVSNFALGAARRIGSAVSVGLTGGISRMSMTLDHARYAANYNDPGFLVNRAVVTTDGGKASAPYFNLGVIARNSAETFSVGATFKKRPRFEDMAVEMQDDEGQAIEGVPGTFSVKLPDAFGAGVAFRAGSHLTLSAAAEQVMYSQLAENITSLYATDGMDRSEDYQADDGLDLRLGAEWGGTRGQTPFAIRAGLARLAPSNIYYQGSDDADRLLFGTEPGESVTEVSAGVGAVLMRHVQIDLAAALSDVRREVIASIVLMR